MTEREKLVLVDGSSYLYRAFHALPPLTTAGGEPTGAVLGVLNMLNKLVREEEPQHIAVVFDAPGKTFRDEMFEEYKANRPPMPDELRSQVLPLLEAVEAMGLPLLRIDGVEADDVIGTLSRRALDRGMEVLISTGDKDMAQLVGGGIGLVNTMTDTRLDRDGVKGKYDVWPEQIVDWIALVGDSSDNIPGVPRVGAKTAAKWLNQYGGVDEIVADADSIKGKVGESLREHLEELELSRRLATIRDDVELDVDPDGLAPGEPDVERLRGLYQRLELRTLLRQLDEAFGAPAPAADKPGTDYELVADEEALSRWLERIDAADLTALDTETDSLNYMAARLVGISLSVEPGAAAYIPVGHDYAGAPEQLDRDLVLERLRPWLEDASKPKVGHHLKYDAHVFRRYGIRLAGMRYDSMLESYVLNSTATRHDMGSTARHYLGLETIPYEQVAGKGAKQITFDQVALEEALPYAAEDADVTLQLHHRLWGELAETGRLRKVYEEIEQPLVAVLTEMEETGVLLDCELLRTQSRELAEKMRAAEKKAHEIAGGPFNLGSPKQLQEILFERQELPVIRKTPKGQPSTAEDVLQELAADYELPEVILEYRGLSKLKSTYTDKLPELVGGDGRIHTSYHQAVAATGRLSSSDPNLQNIPIRTPEGRRIRQAFVAPDGYRILAADYSQIELRIMAHLSGDEGLLAAFADDEDIHRATAAEVFDTALDEVTGEQRRSAKAINFGLIYGMSAFGLARQLGIPRADAQAYVERYFERYPGVRAYMDSTREQAHEKGYVETVMGRRLYLPEINSRNVQRRQYAERSAINAPMQGTAADIIKRAMIDVHRWLAEEDVDARVIMQVHDELVLEVAEAAADAVAAGLVERMSRAAELAVPLKVDTGVGANWDEAH
ncbi:MAG TPA: DNA polymerase I [Woeseiaceae bacterium]|nr:DNA polymerase I [Woeseiaceae bacterium]